MPTIAAVNGPAVGAGLCLALACDIRYAAASARMSVPVRPARDARRDGGDVHRCRTSSGEAHARDLLLTGRMVDADEALRIGLVSERHARRRRSSTTVLTDGGGHRRRPRRSRAGSPRSRCATAATPTSTPRSQWEALAQPVTLATEDLQEGVRAARSAAPGFTGR